MSDDLRTRIAAVADRIIREGIHVDLPTSVMADDLADAVIRELKLKREVDDRASFRMESSRARYVTEWNTDE